MLFIAWVVFHVIICISLILVVLMQSAKGEGLAGGTAFGGGVSGAVFGGRGAASFLSKATTVLAIVFMINCGALAYMSSNTQVADNGSGTGDSAITRKATEERDAALQRQAQQQEATQQNATQQDATQQGANNGEVPLNESVNEDLPVLYPSGDSSSGSGN